MSLAGLLRRAIDEHKLNRAAAEPGTAPRSKEPYPCVHRGAVVGLRDCTTCAGKVALKVFACTKFETCELSRCADCPEREEPWPLVYDHKNLWPGSPGLRFNPSIIEWGDGFALAARTGWKGSDILVGRLDRKFHPVGGPTKLELRHPAANYGREDPRLFVHNDQLHVAFCGVEGHRTLKRTSVLLAQLTDDFRVRRVWLPQIPNRREWEKNWNFVSHEGNLYALYTVSPHKWMKIDGDKAEWCFETPCDIPWDGGEMRGGASFTKVGDEYWHFFHDRIERHGHRIYRTGLYTCDAFPPFRPRRYVPVPILTPCMTNKPSDQYCYVVWTAGAVRAGNDWVLSNGVHDRFIELERLRHDKLENRLVLIERASKSSF